MSVLGRSLSPRWPPSHQARLMGALAVFAVVAVGIPWGYANCNCLGKQYDDAYITFRYAEKLASGHGLVFNVGDMTDSASSFLYTVVLALCHLVGLHDLPVVATVLGVICAAGTSAIVYLGCLAHTNRQLLSAGLGIALGMHGLISGWAVSGMETLFFTALTTLAIYRMFFCSSLTWFDALLIAAIDLTRFEGLILAAAWFLLVVARYQDTDREGRRRFWLQLAVVAGSFAAFLIFKRATYGTFLPHAFELKRITALYAPRPRALWDLWQNWAAVPAVLGLCGLLKLPRRSDNLVLALYCGLSIVSLIVGPYADWARYSVHMLPVMMLLSAVPLSILLRSLPPLALVCFVLIAMPVYDSFITLRAANTQAAGHQACRLKVGAYLEHNLERSLVVLSSDIGAIAYAAPSVSFIDAVGLTSRDILETHGRGENPDRVLFDRKPVVIADTCSGECTRPRQFSSHNWLNSQNYWLTPLPRSVYELHLERGQLLERCRSPDGLYFGAARFELLGIDGTPP